MNTEPCHLPHSGSPIVNAVKGVASFNQVSLKARPGIYTIAFGELVELSINLKLEVLDCYSSPLYWTMTA
jgi:hypothetical protein